jgi:hypothetical protein
MWPSGRTTYRTASNDAEAGERLAARVEQDLRCGLGVACQPVHCQSAVPFPQRGDTVVGPAGGGTAQEEVEGGRGQSVMQPRRPTVPDDAGVG